MAARRRLIVAATLLAATGAHGAPSCEEEHGRTGIAVAVREGAVVVGTVAPESPAAENGLAPDDVLVQANATVLRSCGDWARAARDARRERKALLLLVRRGDQDRAVVLPVATWGPPPVEEPARASAHGPRTFAAAPPPPPLPDDVAVSVPSVVRTLTGLADPDVATDSLTAYHLRVVDARRQIETLDARHAASAEWLGELRRVVRLHEAADVAWAAVEEARERQHRPRHLPFAEEVSAPYFEESEPAALIDEFPVLRQAVVTEPSPGLGGERSGAWRPLLARRLLWEQARTATTGLAGRPGADGP